MCTYVKFRFCKIIDSYLINAEKILYQKLNLCAYENMYALNQHQRASYSICQSLSNVMKSKNDVVRRPLAFL